MFIPTVRKTCAFNVSSRSESPHSVARPSRCSAERRCARNSSMSSGVRSPAATRSPLPARASLPHRFPETSIATPAPTIRGASPSPSPVVTATTSSRSPRSVLRPADSRSSAPQIRKCCLPTRACHGRCSNSTKCVSSAIARDPHVTIARLTSAAASAPSTTATWRPVRQAISPPWQHRCQA